MNNTLFKFTQSFVLVATLTLGACGMDDSETSDDSTAATATTTTTTKTSTTAGCPASAVASFQTNIEPVIDSVCSTCHSTNPTRTFTSGSTAANRTALLAFTGTNAATLKAKIHSSAHGGGDQSSNLTSTKIDSWIAAEVVCAQ